MQRRIAFIERMVLRQRLPRVIECGSVLPCSVGPSTSKS